jgi:hypothetical protein
MAGNHLVNEIFEESEAIRRVYAAHPAQENSTVEAGML